ncbi:hypothetical protein [Kitasatospora sp. NPDC002040]
MARVKALAIPPAWREGGSARQAFLARASPRRGRTARSRSAATLRP